VGGLIGGVGIEYNCRPVRAGLVLIECIVGDREKFRGKNKK